MGSDLYIEHKTQRTPSTVLRRQTHKESVPEDQIISKQSTRISENQEKIVKRAVESANRAYSSNESTILIFEFRALNVFRVSNLEFPHQRA
jgi:hypothetical protein